MPQDEGRYMRESLYVGVVDMDSLKSDGFDEEDKLELVASTVSR